MPRSSRVLGTVRMLSVDLAPLRQSRDFRLLFAGHSISYAGTMMTNVAVPFQAFALTHSSLIVGVLSFIELVPILVVSFVGGALADAVDRRRMVQLTEFGMCMVSAILLVNALSGHAQLWVLFVAVALAAGLDSLQRPSLDALVPRIVAPEQVQAAVAVQFVWGDAGQLLGPAVAGVLIATIGLGGTYGVDVATFAASLTALTLMRAVPPPPGGDRVSVRSVIAGICYAASRKDLLGTYLVDINAMFFGMPTALFPQLATHLGGPAVLGVLYASPAAGSLLASVSSGRARKVHRRGRAIAIAAGAWGVAVALLGLAPALWAAALALVAAGAADCISGLFRTTMWNQTIPDALRGRLAGIEMISYSSGPALGNLEAGVVGSLAGLRTAIVSGGVACVGGTVLLSVALPAFWRYTSHASP